MASPPLSLRMKRSNLVNNVVAYATPTLFVILGLDPRIQVIGVVATRHISHYWIATVAMLPRDDKKHRAKFPSMEGCRAAAGWSESSRKCNIFVIASVAWQSLFCCCVARARMRPVRILVFVQTALALVFTYSDSLRAIADGVAIQLFMPSRLSCHPGARGPHTLSVILGLDPRIQVIKLVAQRHISHYWIAAVALLPRDDKERITLILSCHCEPSQMAWQSSK